jgi:hypothetical protein
VNRTPNNRKEPDVILATAMMGMTHTAGFVGVALIS